MATPYLQYADMINRGGDFSQGLSALGQTIDQERMMQRQAQQDAQTRRLSDLQIESAGLNFAQDKARSLADINQYETQGEGDFTQQLAAAEAAKTKEMQMQKQREAKQKGMETYLNTISILDKMPNLDEATKTAIGKEFLKQNPEYAPIAEKLTFVSSKGVKAAREFGEGELKDPVTGKPLPAGYYETEGTWTGDAANPVKLTNYKLVEKKTDYKSRERIAGDKTVFEESLDGGKTWKKVSEGPRYKPAQAGGGNGKPEKPLPPSALKLRQDALDAVGVASGIQADVDGFIGLIDSGKLDLGPIKNLGNRALNFAGISTEESANLTNFKTSLEKLRNDILVLAKGVQTDGDALRAYNTLVENINDEKVVRQQLVKIKENNARNERLQLAKVDTIQNEYGKGALDTSGYTGQKAAIGKSPKQPAKVGRFTIEEVK